MSDELQLADSTESLGRLCAQPCPPTCTMPDSLVVGSTHALK